MILNVVLEKISESPLDCKEIKPVNLKGNQSWILIWRTDAEAEAPILWPPDVKSWLIGKDPDAGKDWRREEKRTTEDEMVGWHHQLNGHEFGQALGDSEGQGSLACCSSWGCKESDMTEQLNNNNMKIKSYLFSRLWFAKYFCTGYIICYDTWSRHCRNAWETSQSLASKCHILTGKADMTYIGHS